MGEFFELALSNLKSCCLVCVLCLTHFFFCANHLFNYLLFYLAFLSRSSARSTFIKRDLWSRFVGAWPSGMQVYETCNCNLRVFKKCEFLKEIVSILSFVLVKRRDIYIFEQNQGEKRSRFAQVHILSNHVFLSYKYCFHLNFFNHCVRNFIE